MNDYQLDYLKELLASKKQPELMSGHVVTMKRCRAYWTMTVITNPAVAFSCPGV